MAGQTHDGRRPAAQGIRRPGGLDLDRVVNVGLRGAVTGLAVASKGLAGAALQDRAVEPLGGLLRNILVADGTGGRIGVLGRAVSGESVSRSNEMEENHSKGGRTCRSRRVNERSDCPRQCDLPLPGSTLVVAQSVDCPNARRTLILCWPAKFPASPLVFAPHGPCRLDPALPLVRNVPREHSCEWRPAPCNTPHQGHLPSVEPYIPMW